MLDRHDRGFQELPRDEPSNFRKENYFSELVARYFLLSLQEKRERLPQHLLKIHLHWSRRHLANRCVCGERVRDCRALDGQHQLHQHDH